MNAYVLQDFRDNPKLGDGNRKTTIIHKDTIAIFQR